jgi:tRNA (mo5U34)-methyltransferase
LSATEERIPFRHAGFPTTAAEREVADVLPIEAKPAECRRVLDRVPFWFHTFALNREQRIYTPGAARDHRYRLPAISEDFDGAAVLDVGSFDGFYAFLAEHRGAGRVMAVDNEQYRAWVKTRWGIELRGGEGFREIHGLLASRVDYARIDALELAELDARFDVVFCFGILHRVEDPGRLLEVMRERLDPEGQVLIETYGVEDERRDGSGGIAEHRPGEVYAGDAYVYWGFSSGGLGELAAAAGFADIEVLDTPVIDRHPRILAMLSL